MPFTDSTFSPETSPGYLVRLIHQMSVAAIDRALAADGMTATQWTTLVSLYFNHADTCGGLARALGHDAGAMTRMVDQLEANGWVERQRDAIDRRIVRLSLTAAGRDAAVAAKQKVIACWNGFLADWSDAEVADLIATLQRLRHTMESDPCAA
ncbi:MarR family winged helix-turn-helix transcriptional regulator [Sphingomonas radiodurans]|uniref:MarR family winged helix-turn-helix transcriptional regulator n=1 Tax=Sphingomonas radiodurans TaxID=2890321 RepID=UPI001E4D40AF|nr:MarR family transcriptional regulator [Sphingomonas radiodurans]WBH15379.1 MarR family transcriptional regulator [Sphingomonas radiodurans]